MEMTDQNESDEQIKRRVKTRMSLALAVVLAASVAAPFAVEAVGWDLMDVVVAVTVALVLFSGWRVVKALRTTSPAEAEALWLSHTVLWVYSMVGLGLAGIVSLFAQPSSQLGQSWILLAYAVPMAAVSLALRHRATELLATR